jgi:hypothetical protein
MAEVATAPEYQSPADGRLTARQIEMYLDVRRREREIREVEPDDLANAATADLRAALELGYNPKEYSWVEERVLEAQMLQTTQALRHQIDRGREAILSRLEEQRRTAADDAQRSEIEKQIAALREGAAAAREPAREFNSSLIARYADDFEKLRREERNGQQP